MDEFGQDPIQTKVSWNSRCRRMLVHSFGYVDGAFPDWGVMAVPFSAFCTGLESIEVRFPTFRVLEPWVWNVDPFHAPECFWIARGYSHLRGAGRYLPY